jgi:hypothetical protein
MSSATCNPAWEWKYSGLNPFAILRPEPVKTHSEVLKESIETTKNDLLKERVASEYHKAMDTMLATRLTRLTTELSRELSRELAAAETEFVSQTEHTYQSGAANASSAVSVVTPHHRSANPVLR